METLAVEELRVGDEMLLPKLGVRIVSAVERYDDGAIVVVYFQYGTASFENKARDRGGYTVRAGLCERGMRPHRAGDLLQATRGNPLKAEQLRSRMEREQAERGAARGYS